MVILKISLCLLPIIIWTIIGLNLYGKKKKTNRKLYSS